MASHRIRIAALIASLFCLGPLGASIVKWVCRIPQKGSVPRTSRDASPRINDTARANSYVEAADRLLEELNRGDINLIYENMSNENKASYTIDSLGRLADKIVREKGPLTSHGKLVVTGNSASMRVRAERGEWVARFSLDRVGRFRGFSFRDAPLRATSQPRNIVRMRLPFQGEWVVTSGGNEQSENFHSQHSLDFQAKALDFAIHDATGKGYRGVGNRNEDFYCYKQKVLSPADGDVCVVIDGVPDNEPGTINPIAAGGNSIILRHAGGEYSAFHHLQPNSITVKVGDRVKANQVVARCGNSGNSLSPHLHFHLMSSKIPMEAESLLPFFDRVLVRRSRESTAVVKEDYSPSAGDILLEEKSRVGEGKGVWSRGEGKGVWSRSWEGKGVGGKRGLSEGKGVWCWPAPQNLVQS